MDPRAGVDAVKKRFFTPAGNQTPIHRSSIPQPGYYTERDIIYGLFNDDYRL